MKYLFHYKLTLLMLLSFSQQVSAFKLDPAESLINACENQVDSKSFQSFISKIPDDEKPPFTEEFCKAFNLCEGYGYGSECNRAQQKFFSFKNSISGKSGDCGMDAEEAAVLYAYTGSFYRCLNRYLWDPNGKSDFSYLVKKMNSALAKLPSYKGFVRRGADLPRSVRETHKKDAIVNYAAFTSTSTDSGFSASDNFLIYSLSGKPIMKLSGISYENEVLFPSGINFKILEVSTKDGGNTYIMREVPAKSSKDDLTDKQVLDLVKNNSDSGKGDADSWACPLKPEEKIPSVINQKRKPSGLDKFKS